MTVEREATAANPIRVTSDDRAEVEWIAPVVLKRRVAGRDIGDDSSLIRNPNAQDPAAELHEVDLEAAGTSKRVRRRQFGVVDAGRDDTRITPAPWSVPQRVVAA